MSRGPWINNPHTSKPKGCEDATAIMLRKVGVTAKEIKRAGARFTNYIPAPVNNWAANRKKGVVNAVIKN